MNGHFDRFAWLYDRIIRPPNSAGLSRLLGLPVDGPVLEAGGGTARVAAQLSSGAGRVVVCDLSLPMLKRAGSKNGLWTVQAPVEHLPFADGAFSRVLVVDALHHFADQEAAMAELVRVLQPGGRLVVEEPDIRTVAVKAVALAEKLALMGSRFLPPDAIRSLAAARGCQARIERKDRFVVWIVADKGGPPVHASGRVAAERRPT